MSRVSYLCLSLWYWWCITSLWFKYNKLKSAIPILTHEHCSRIKVNFEDTLIMQSPKLVNQIQTHIFHSMAFITDESWCCHKQHWEVYIVPLSEHINCGIFCNFIYTLIHHYIKKIYIIGSLMTWLMVSFQWNILHL